MGYWVANVCTVSEAQFFMLSMATSQMVHGSPANLILSSASVYLRAALRRRWDADTHPNYRKKQSSPVIVQTLTRKASVSSSQVSCQNGSLPKMVLKNCSLVHNQ